MINCYDGEVPSPAQWHDIGPINTMLGQFRTMLSESMENDHPFQSRLPLPEAQLSAPHEGIWVNAVDEQEGLIVGQQRA